MAFRQKNSQKQLGNVDELKPSKSPTSINNEMRAISQNSHAPVQKTDQQQQNHNSSNHNLSNLTPDQILNQKKEVFITNINNQQGNQKTQSIYDLYGELNSIIENLDSKVDGVIERHEAEFLMAYRNHMSKIRKELAEMKKRTDEQEKNFHANDKISGLEKKVKWFQDESLHLYEILTQKDKDVDELKMQIQDLSKEKQFLEEQVKALLKKTKYLEVKVINMNRDADQSFQNQQNYYDESYNIQQKHSTSPNLSQQQLLQQQQTDNVLLNDLISEEQLQQLQQIEKTQTNGGIVVSFIKKYQNNYVQLAQELTNFINKNEEKRNKQAKLMRDKLEKTMKEKLRMNVVRSDLENFFLECVETVRRQIIRRKYMNKEQQNMNLYLNEVKDYNVFRMEDKIKILELLVSNEKLLIYLYQKIFPSQFNMYLQTALDKEQQTPHLPNLNNNNNNMLEENNEMENIVNDINNTQPHYKKNQSFDMGDNNKLQQNLNKSFEMGLGGRPRKNIQRRNQITEKVMVKKGKLLFRPNQ